jgi:hypothetical protein
MERYCRELGILLYFDLNRVCNANFTNPWAAVFRSSYKMCRDIKDGFSDELCLRILREKWDLML